VFLKMHPFACYTKTLIFSDFEIAIFFKCTPKRDPLCVACEIMGPNT
jgi:hypothetical protein